jgi:hypothetical protein
MRYNHVNDTSVKSAMALIDNHRQPEAKIIRIAMNG